MADTGWLSFTTFASREQEGRWDVWANPENAASSNDVYAVITPTSWLRGEELVASGLSADGIAGIPDGSTIDGFLVGVEGHYTVQTLSWIYGAQLERNGVLIGARDSEMRLLYTTDDYPSKLKIWNGIGGDSPPTLWGAEAGNWTKANLSDLGVAIDTGQDGPPWGTICVDQILIKVYYTAPPDTIDRRDWRRRVYQRSRRTPFSE